MFTEISLCEFEKIWGVKSHAIDTTPDMQLNVECITYRTYTCARLCCNQPQKICNVKRTGEDNKPMVALMARTKIPELQKVDYY
jgi:hypothetical protein